MSGQKRKVVLVIQRAEKYWILSLECGHTVRRRVRLRRKRMASGYEEDPSPSWVYCEECVG